MKTIKTLVLVAVLGSAFTGLAHGQDAPKNPAVKAVQGARELTTEDLVRMLETMGYEVRVEDSADKQTTWLHVKITRTELGGTFETSMVLSPNKKKIWSHVNITELKPEHLENAAAMAKLLELNAAEGPNHFRLDAKTKYLYLSRCTDNRALTPAMVKEHIENLVEAAIRTKDHWNTTKWTATTSTSVQK